MKLNSLAPTAIMALAAAVAAESSHPSFTPFDESKFAQKDHFLDQFTYESEAELAKVWKVSHATKDAEFAYVGKFAVEEPSVYPGFKNDKGLVLKTPAAHHAISHKLAKPFDNTDNTLVMQYEVKLQNGLVCGGAYVKLLSAEGFHGEDADEFDGETPYQIMFGPDKCGATNKVHLIIKRPNPVTGEIIERHLGSPPQAKIQKTSVLYTLIIEPNQDFQIRINGEVAIAGNFLEQDHLYPPLNPPKYIPDPDEEKPESWDEREEIPDPDQAEKPDDWDESLPPLIRDPSSIMPEGWKEDEPFYIVDPEAEKPEDWDDEEDGEWLAPEIPNPVCFEIAGCGPFKPLMMANPEYKGKWVQPYITNPEFQGKWAPQEIENPEYFEDIKPSNVGLIGGLGFELWTMEGDILFDNIYLGHSIEDAETLGNATFVEKTKLEEDDQKANAPRAPNAPEQPPKGLYDEADYETEENVVKRHLLNAYAFVTSYSRDAQQFANEFVNDPVVVLSTRYMEALYYVSTFLGSFTLVFGLWSTLMYYLVGGPAEQPVKKEPKIVEVEGDAKTSGAKKASTTASKRKN
ncbi:hypothetical protein BABINDRAFT_162829 [Babjeviella inositovora NRRL Y-12698]|uniref:Calnexin n=1 Tax=Babjeviella inositovora NRRL Y-12698 TaxID=984486 RepID=A0A1E3QKC7_9ASCO|nr:uncharacterized protein BABINDRAFT_162829 [Babjeviella inositovora NRRL Y-12698]ODQ78156.1 hypothetical protein BABINDRAFT_162829 [Babjeviella inositovora NRRL Y-12698]